jgi:hypothetical protein
MQTIERDAVKQVKRDGRAGNCRTKYEAMGPILVVTLQHSSTLPKGVDSTSPHS